MSVQNEIDRISQNVANTYAVLEALGCEMPEEQNSDNLATTARTTKVVEHIGSKDIHVTPEEKQAWNKKSNFSGSWNDLKDRPFGEELETETVVAENMVTTKKGVACWYGDMTEYAQNLEFNYGGELFAVTVDGVLYKCLTWHDSAYESNAFFIGDSRIWGSDDNVIYESNQEDVPFLIEVYFEGDSWFDEEKTLSYVTAYYPDSNPHTIKIEKITGETTKVIDEKYLPESVKNDGSAVADMPVVVTSSDGVEYECEVDGIETLYRGLALTIIPEIESTSTSYVTLNVNGLGAKSIKRGDNLTTTEWWSFTNAGWFKANCPVRVMFNGTYWMVQGMTKPYATDLYGSVPIEKGGTGATTLAAAKANLEIPTDEHINSLINTALGVIENGSY